MLFIENDKKYSTPIWSRVLALARRFSSSELLGALRNSIVYLIRVMFPLSGGDGWTGEYRLETGSRHIAFKRLLNVY